MADSDQSTQRFAASSNGVSVALYDFGGTGEPLLISHATGFHARTYLPLLPVLTQRFHVWAFDFRGHGGSSAPSDGVFGWDGVADDVLAAIDEIGAPSVFAFGHSMGGAALLGAEVKRPGTIARAYLYEPIVLPAGVFDHDENPLAAVSRRRREVFPSKADALMRYATRAPLSGIRADALAAYVTHGFDDGVYDGQPGTRLACRAENEARTFEMTHEPNWESVLAAKTPVAIAIGHLEPEAQGPAALGPSLADTLPTARLIRYENLRHFGPLQDPDGIAADVVAFLGEGR